MYLAKYCLDIYFFKNNNSKVLDVTSDINYIYEKLNSKYKKISTQKYKLYKYKNLINVIEGNKSFVIFKDVIKNNIDYSKNILTSVYSYQKKLLEQFPIIEKYNEIIIQEVSSFFDKDFNIYINFINEKNSLDEISSYIILSFDIYDNNTIQKFLTFFN